MDSHAHAHAVVGTIRRTPSLGPFSAYLDADANTNAYADAHANTTCMVDLGIGRLKRARRASLGAATNGVLAGGERIGSGPGGVAHAPGCSIAWTTLGLADKNIFALVHAANGVLYAGTYGDGVYRSTDNGVTWNPVNNGLTDTHIYGLAAHPTAANILLAATLEQGVFRSTNGGDSWQRTSPSGADNLNTVAFDPTNGAFAFAGTFDHGLYKSQDGGASFHASNSGLTNNRVWAIASAPSNATIVYAGTSDGVFRSTNRGDLWQPVGLASNEVRALAVDPQNANRVYAGTKSGRVWLTNNGGASWQDASSGLPAPRSIWALRLDPVCNRLLAGTSNGVYQLSLSGQVPTPTPTRVPTVTPTPTITPIGGSWTTIATENFEGAFPKAGWRTFDNYVRRRRVLLG